MDRALLQLRVQIARSGSKIITIKLTLRKLLRLETSPDDISEDDRN
jgi:hypothetical protein